MQMYFWVAALIATSLGVPAKLDLSQHARSGYDYKIPLKPLSTSSGHKTPPSIPTGDYLPPVNNFLTPSSPAGSFSLNRPDNLLTIPDKPFKPFGSTQTQHHQTDITIQKPSTSFLLPPHENVHQQPDNTFQQNVGLINTQTHSSTQTHNLRPIEQQNIFENRPWSLQTQEGSSTSHTTGGLPHQSHIHGSHAFNDHKNKFHQQTSGVNQHSQSPVFDNQKHKFGQETHSHGSHQINNLDYQFGQPSISQNQQTHEHGNHHSNIQNTQYALPSNSQNQPTHSHGTHQFDNQHIQSGQPSSTQNEQTNVHENYQFDSQNSHYVPPLNSQNQQAHSHQNHHGQQTSNQNQLIHGQSSQHFDNLNNQFDQSTSGQNQQTNTHGSHHFDDQKNKFGQQTIDQTQQTHSHGSHHEDNLQNKFGHQTFNPNQQQTHSHGSHPQDNQNNKFGQQTHATSSQHFSNPNAFGQQTNVPFQQIKPFFEPPTSDYLPPSNYQESSTTNLAHSGSSIFVPKPGTFFQENNQHSVFVKQPANNIHSHQSESFGQHSHIQTQQPHTSNQPSTGNQFPTNPHSFGGSFSQQTSSHTHQTHLKKPHSQQNKVGLHSAFEQLENQSFQQVGQILTHQPTSSLNHQISSTNNQNSPLSYHFQSNNQHPFIHPTHSFKQQPTSEGFNSQHKGSTSNQYDSRPYVYDQRPSYENPQSYQSDPGSFNLKQKQPFKYEFVQPPYSHQNSLGASQNSFANHPTSLQNSQKETHPNSFPHNVFTKNHKFTFGVANPQKEVSLPNKNYDQSKLFAVQPQQSSLPRPYTDPQQPHLHQNNFQQSHETPSQSQQSEQNNMYRPHSQSNNHHQDRFPQLNTQQPHSQQNNFLSSHSQKNKPLTHNNVYSSHHNPLFSKAHVHKSSNFQQKRPLHFSFGQHPNIQSDLNNIENGDFKGFHHNNHEQSLNSNSYQLHNQNIFEKHPSNQVLHPYQTNTFGQQSNLHSGHHHNFNQHSGSPTTIFNNRKPSSGTKGLSGSGKMLMPYDFGYNVDDNEYGTKFSHSENSDGNLVTGEYSVLLPDGRTQIVRFTSGPSTGYVADVSYVRI